MLNFQSAVTKELCFDSAFIIYMTVLSVEELQIEDLGGILLVMLINVILINSELSLTTLVFYVKIFFCFIVQPALELILPLPDQVL